MNNHLLVSGSIVLYKNNEEVFKAIQSFLDAPLAVKFYLIDNSPTDVLRTTLQHFLADSRVEYVYNNANIGYGAGHNIAIRQSLAAGCKYHFILNPDVAFEPNVIIAICRYMDGDSSIGAVMPKIIYENGATQYLCKLLPTPIDLFARRFLPERVSRKQQDQFELRATGYNQIMEVPFLSGCFMALRKEALMQCGLFDERFFMYGEDIDFSRRINEQFKTMFYPHVSIVHGYEAASYKSLKMLKIHTQSIIRYFNKWGWFFDKRRKQTNRRILAQFK